MTIFILRWLRRKPPAIKPEPAHVKRLVRAGMVNIIMTTGKGGRLR